MTQQLSVGWKKKSGEGGLYPCCMQYGTARTILLHDRLIRNKNAAYTILLHNHLIRNKIAVLLNLAHLSHRFCMRNPYVKRGLRET